MFETEDEIEISDMQYFQNRGRDLVLFEETETRTLHNMIPEAYYQDLEGIFWVGFSRGDKDGK